jgi:DhnA family fructose-bisphosphate aldolase class Ia
MKRRMHRLLRPDGRILIVAMDHTAFLDEPAPGLVRYGETVRAVVPAGADAFLSPIGSIQNFADAFGPAPVVASVSTDSPFLEVAVERALAVGADAVKSMVYPFTDDDSVIRAQRLAADAAAVGLPYIAEPIPGGFSRHDLRSAATIAAGARIAAESGADVIKTFYPGTPEGMRQVVEYAMVPVVVLGGSRKDTLRELFQEVHDAVVLGGAAGVAIGNNIWRAPDPAAVTRGLAAIIHDGHSVDEAIAIAGETRTA